MFIRSFTITNIIDVGAPTIAPTRFDLGIFTPITFTQGPPTDRINVFFDNTDEWANAGGGALYIRQSPPVTSAINFFNGPWVTAGSIKGAATPPTSPQFFPGPNNYSSGDRIFLKVRAIMPDGRLTTTQVAQFDVP